jgi:hypothetical protein
MDNKDEKIISFFVFLLLLGEKALLCLATKKSPLINPTKDPRAIDVMIITLLE